MVASFSDLRNFASNRLICNGVPKKRPRQNFRAAQFREEMRRWERRVKRGREDVLFTTVYCIAQGIWQDAEAKKIAPLIRTGHMACQHPESPAMGKHWRERPRPANQGRDHFDLLRDRHGRASGNQGQWTHLGDRRDAGRWRRRHPHFEFDNRRLTLGPGPAAGPNRPTRIWRARRGAAAPHFHWVIDFTGVLSRSGV